MPSIGLQTQMETETVVTLSIVVYSLHVSSQLAYFLSHLCNVHVVRVIQFSLQSPKNLGLENNNREDKDKTLRVHFCTINPHRHHPSSTSHASSVQLQSSHAQQAQEYFISVTACAPGTEAQTGMAKDVHIFFVLPINWQ